MAYLAYHATNSTAVPDNFAYVVPVDYEYHTAGKPFCYDPDCPCHTDQEAIAGVKEQYDAGLITAEEAELIIKGKTL